MAQCKLSRWGWGFEPASGRDVTPPRDVDLDTEALQLAVDIA